MSFLHCRRVTSLRKSGQVDYGACASSIVLELCWTDVSDRGVPSDPIVEHLDVFANRFPRTFTVEPRAAVDQLVLQRAKKLAVTALMPEQWARRFSGPAPAVSGWLGRVRNAHPPGIAGILRLSSDAARVTFHHCL